MQSTRVFCNTLDVHTVAVDAATGKEVWKTKPGDINMGDTMAPIVKGKVLVGNSGGEFGVRGWTRFGISLQPITSNTVTQLIYLCHR
jgi:glucose dehydrogenase